MHEIHAGHEEEAIGNMQVQQEQQQQPTDVVHDGALGLSLGESKFLKVWNKFLENALLSHRGDRYCSAAPPLNPLL